MELEKRKYICFISVIFCFFIYTDSSSPPIPSQPPIKILSSSQNSSMLCFLSISFDMCLNDPTNICKEHFYLDQFVQTSYSKMLFEYLLKIFMTQNLIYPIYSIFPDLVNGNISLQNNSPFGLSYVLYIDNAYPGSNCSLLYSNGTTFDGNITDIMVTSMRNLWLIMMRLNSPCTENEVFVLGQGCVCNTDKVCAEVSAESVSGSNSTIAGVAGIILGIQIWIIYLFVKHGSSVQTEFGVLINKVNSLIQVLSPQKKNLATTKRNLIIK